MSAPRPRRSSGSYDSPRRSFDYDSDRGFQIRGRARRSSSSRERAPREPYPPYDDRPSSGDERRHRFPDLALDEDYRRDAGDAYGYDRQYGRPDDRYRRSRDRYDWHEDHYVRHRDQYDRNEDAYDYPRDRYDRNEDPYDYPRDRYDRNEDPYDYPQDPFERRIDRHERSRDRYEQPQNDYVEPQPQNEQPEDDTSNGELDLGEQPLKYLLIRGLKPNVNEQTFAKGLDKFYRKDGETGAIPNSLKRVFLIRDRRTHQSLGYGLAEYFSVKDAIDALGQAKNLGSRCTISSKLVFVDFPHLGVFPDVAALNTKVNYKYTFEDNGTRRQYRDNRYFASECIINETPPEGTELQTQSDTGEATAQESDASKGHKRTITSHDAGIINDEPKLKKSKIQPKSLAIMEHWNSKRAEYRGAFEDKDQSKESSILNPVTDQTGGNTSSFAKNGSTTTKDHRPLDPGDDNLQTFIYIGSHNGQRATLCLLCGSKLPEHLQPEKHVLESTKHRENLDDAAKYKAGLERIKKKGITEADTFKMPPRTKPPNDDSLSEPDLPPVRDSTTIAQAAPVNFNLKAKPAPKKTKKPSPSPPPVMSKGMRMLQKAGWTPGASLGTTGTGRTAPIEQSVYAAGIGLGHEGSKQGDAVKEAERLTRDDKGSFAEKTRELARQRFERMG